MAACPLTVTCINKVHNAREVNAGNMNEPSTVSDAVDNSFEVGVFIVLTLRITQNA